MLDVICVGVAVYDQVFHVPDVTLKYAKHFASSHSVSVGGPATVAAQTVAALEGKVSLITQIGADQAGKYIRTELERWVDDPDWILVDSQSATPVSAVVVNGEGERLIVNYTESTELLLVRVDLPSAGVMLCDSRWVEGTSYYMQLGQEAGMKLVLDLDSSPEPERLEPLVNMASHVVASREGLAQFFGTDDVVAAIRALVSQGKWVAVTDGSNPIIFADRSGSGRVPTFPVAVKTSLGAGDVFHGAFALSLARGMSAPDALVYSAAAAAHRCEHVGQRGIPTPADVEKILLRQRGM